jgi:hypothetical protein
VRLCVRATPATLAMAAAQSALLRLAGHAPCRGARVRRDCAAVLVPLFVCPENGLCTVLTMRSGTLRDYRAWHDPSWHGSSC